MSEGAVRVRLVASCLLLVLAAAQAWAFRHTVSPDGVAYLDLSDAIVHGRPGDLVNGYWSPLYATVIGVLRLIVGPTPLGNPYWEFAIVHVANFLGFALSLLAFEWLLAAVRHASRSWEQPMLSSAFELAIAYALFGAAMLVMVSVSGTVPDPFLAAAVLGSSGCLLRLQQDPKDRRTAVVLGLVLAGGALTKSIMFPLTVVMIVCLVIATRGRARAAAFTASATFVAATLPWCIAISMALGRPTTGETGALNFAWYVNHQQPPVTGVLPRLALAAEPLPIGGVAVLREPRGTNPLWYDPARWHADVRPRFDPRQIATRIASNALFFLSILSPLVLVALSIASAAPWGAIRSTLARASVVALPSLAAIAAYATTYATARYIGPFVLVAAIVLAAAFPRDVPLRLGRLILSACLVLLLLDAFSPLRGRVLIAYAVATVAGMIGLSTRFRDWRRWTVMIVGSAAALWLVLLTPVMIVRIMVLVIGLAGWLWDVRRSSGSEPFTAASMGARAFVVAAVAGLLILNFLTGSHAVLRLNSSAVHPDWDAAQRVVRAGVPEGSKIAVLGNPTTAGWARLARYQIVGMIPDTQVEAFARLSPAEREHVIAAFRGVGAVQLIRAAP